MNTPEAVRAAIDRMRNSDCSEILTDSVILAAEVERLQKESAANRALVERVAKLEAELSVSDSFNRVSSKEKEFLVYQLSAANEELQRWRSLQLWGATPEVVEQFIKGQQERIYACQELECELTALQKAKEDAEQENAELHSAVVAELDARIKAEQQLAALRAIDPVLAEISRAMKKFPTWPTDPLHALSVLGEEFGELTKEMLQCCYEPHKSNIDEVRKEAGQCAAMAIRLYLSLDRYEYKAGPQHEQSALASGGKDF